MLLSNDPHTCKKIYKSSVLLLFQSEQQQKKEQLREIKNEVMRWANSERIS